MPPSRRPTREELDRVIVDAAARLFARHGYSHTSVQQIADAVGYSKTGLLHRFPSKEALRTAVVEQFVAELQAIETAVAHRPEGPGRDLAVLEAVAELSLRRRGTLALLLSALTGQESAEDLAWLHGVAESLFRAFAVADPEEATRRVRIFGALGALGVTALAYPEGEPGPPRDLLVATAYDALGHPRPAAAD